MSSTGAGYDYAPTIYSPDGRIFQIEYAQKAIEAGGTSIGVKCKDGVVLANEKLLYSILNHSKQLENFVLINSVKSLKEIDFKLKDLKSRINSFLYIGIDLPTDELLHVIISKSFSDKQINLNPKISDYIIKNVERSYDKIFKFLKDIDDLSLSSGKSININLIKKVLDK